jgi:hypothetical protein
MPCAICFHSGILLGLFDPEGGGDIFLRNVGWLSTDYKVHIPENNTLHNNLRENFEAYAEKIFSFHVSTFNIQIGYRMDRNL